MKTDMKFEISNSSIFTGLTWQEALEQCPAGVVPACHNSENSVTVSGPIDDVKGFVKQLQEKGTFARLVQSAGVAFHSYFMQDVAPALKSALNKVRQFKVKHGIK